jgi:hypothetical protein
VEHLVSQRDLWEKFERGDGLSLQEVRSLIREAEAALPYLRSRSRALGTIPASDTALTLDRLRGFEQALRKRTA